MTPNTLFALFQRFFVLILALCVPLSAQAVDGVIEINDTKAAAGGVTASDTAGFPVTIDTAGSYRLTSNLTLADENTTGIEITADNVNLDLNGFSIMGSGTCTRNTSGIYTTSVSCTSGSGNGISANSSDHITVYNGTISGAGGFGVLLGDSAMVRNVRVREVASTGIQVGSGSIVQDSISTLNGTNGILTSNRSLVKNCTAKFNDNQGISASGNSQIESSVADGNGNDGISATSFGTHILNSTSTQNAASGFRTSGHARVAGNVSYDNQLYGIEDIGASGTTFYTDNVLVENVAGTVSGPLTQEYGVNICETNTTCP